MRIAVVGAGIIGVTSAYELATAGHEVTVFEQGGSIAADASFAHAGLDGPGSAVAWSPLAVAGSLSGMAVRGRLPAALAPLSNPGRWGWTANWWVANRGTAQPALHQRLHRLAAHSLARTNALAHALHLDFERSQGLLVVSRTASDAERLAPLLAGLDERGVRALRLTPEQGRQIEPGLNPEAELHSAVHLPDEGAGNCREFAHLMKQQAQRLGVRFAFNTRVIKVRPGPRPELTLAAAADPSAPMASPGDRPATETVDAVLVCAAMGSARLLAPLGVKLPLIGLHGMSVTAPLRLSDADAHVGPVSVLIDPRRGTSIVRSGSRVRVSGGARLGRMTRADVAATQTQLYRALDDWFPGAARVTQAQHWHAASPLLPDGLPVLGRSGVDGVWLNVGHGNAGWAVSCGSAQVLASMIGGIAPEIDTEGLGVERFR